MVPWDWMGILQHAWMKEPEPHVLRVAGARSSIPRSTSSSGTGAGATTSILSTSGAGFYPSMEVADFLPIVETTNPEIIDELAGGVLQPHAPVRSPFSYLYLLRNHYLGAQRSPRRIPEYPALLIQRPIPQPRAVHDSDEAVEEAGASGTIHQGARAYRPSRGDPDSGVRAGHGTCAVCSPVPLWTPRSSPSVGSRWPGTWRRTRWTIASTCGDTGGRNYDCDDFALTPPEQPDPRSRLQRLRGHRRRRPRVQRLCPGRRAWSRGGVRGAPD